VYRLNPRYDDEGEAAFEPRSRRPLTSPSAIPDATVELVLRLRKELADAGLDAGADTLCWHLRRHHQVVISRATAHRILVRHATVTPDPSKRPKSSYIRFEAEQPNQTWQSDFTHYRLTTAADVEIITWLDDHSRYALHVSAHHRITGPIVLDTFTTAAAEHGHPVSTLTDNGMVYTVRFAGGRGGRTRLEVELRRLGITQKNSRPSHPTTCGKVERFQQTLKKWLRAQPQQPATITALQALLDTVTDEYNQQYQGTAGGFEVEVGVFATADHLRLPPGVGGAGVLEEPELELQPQNPPQEYAQRRFPTGLSRTTPAAGGPRRDPRLLLTRCSRGDQWSGEVGSTVDVEHVPGDERRIRGAQERHGAGDVVWLPGPAQRVGGQPALGLDRHRSRHRGLDEPGTHAVHGGSEPGQFQGTGPDQAHHTRLGGDVVHLSEVPGVGHHGRDQHHPARTVAP
jgi:transposase InsO family protein